MADRKILNVPFQSAPEGMCSEGAIQMVLRYYGFDPPDQQEISDKIGGFIWSAKPYLSNYLEVSRYGPSSESELYGSIDRGAPVLMRLIPDGQERDNAGHTIVLTGYDRPKRLFYMNDTAFDGPNAEYKRSKLMREWARAGRGTMFVHGRKPDSAPPSLTMFNNGHNYIGDARISLQGGRMMRGINIRSWTAGAVKPAEDSPAGFIWFEGTLVNDLPIPMTGVVGLNAVSMIGAGASVSGKQRMTMGGSALKLMGNTADFKVKVDVPEIGAVGDKWKVALFSGNLLGQMPVYKKEVELTVLAMKVKPELPTKGGLVKTGKTTLRME